MPPSPHRVVRQLDPTTIDQIAAGEVVDRPASVVKELVENALDSGARSIEVTVQEGGLGSICVADDGCGMSAQDARLAVMRYATSKICVVDDLLQVATYGFRGEALSSIASVSRFTLTTRRVDEAVGFRLELHGGKVVAEGPCGCPPGTHLQIEELFYNVPARRKFMRAAVTEQAYVQEALLRCLLGARRGGLIYTAGRRRLLDVAHDCLPDERPRRLLGRRVQRLDAFVAESGPLRISGHLSPPALARNETSGLWLFVNGRFVRDRMLQRAAIEGYQLAFPEGHPTALLYLDLDPAQVDVNVHPQKLEVRFADAQGVFAALREAVAVAADRLRAQLSPKMVQKLPLRSSPHVGGDDGGPKDPGAASMDEPPVTAGGIRRAPTPALAPSSAPRVVLPRSGTRSASRRLQSGETGRGWAPPDAARAGAGLSASVDAAVATADATTNALDRASFAPRGADVTRPASTLPLPLEQGAWQRLRTLGVAPTGYLACSEGTHLVLVALREAYLVAARAAFGAGAGGVALHRLLLPPRYEPRAGQAERLVAFERACAEASGGSPCGIHLQPVDADGWLIQAIPACFAECKPAVVLAAYLATHRDDDALDMSAWVQQLAAMDGWPSAVHAQARWPQRLLGMLGQAKAPMTPPLAYTVTSAQLTACADEPKV